MIAPYGGWRSKPGQGRSLSRVAAVASSTLLLTSAVVATTADPALASLIDFVRPASIATTDSHHPTQAFPATGGNLPVGSWLDDEENRHTSRAYFTFDLTPYQGKRIIRASASIEESAVNDCSAPRMIEFWRSDTPESAPTWKTAPVEREKIGNLGPTSGIACPAAYLGINLTTALQQAVAAGSETITFVTRIHEDVEKKVSYGRWLKNLGISLEYNTAPSAPGELSVNGLACADDLFIGTTTPYLQAQVTDPDINQSGGGDLVRATFAWWPVDRPAERTEWTSYSTYAPARFRYTVPTGLMVNGGVYAFAVRAADTHDQSDWSAECRFTIDTVRPPAPTVTSTDYPADGTSHGGPGIPGAFTFTANGGTDVVGYRYGSSDATTYVAADQLGGSVTLTFTPTRYGINQLYVESIDRTGNRSPEVVYQFLVRDTSPTVTDGNPTGGFGEPRELTFQPRMEEVVEYTYRLNDGPETKVPAAADGTARITITPSKPGHNTVYVRSRTATDLPSGEERYSFYLASMPTVSSEEYPIDGWEGPLTGTPGTFVFRPGMPDVVEYVYAFDWGPEETVRAGADGTASVTYTTRFADYHSLTVYSRTSTGVASETASVGFMSESHAPTVESDTYPMYSEGGGPNVPSTFTFRPARDGVEAYVYAFDDQPEQAVAAGPDGVATLAWTASGYPADTNGWVRLTVRERIGTIVSDSTEYWFRIKPLAPIIAVSLPTGGSVPGVPLEFTLTAQMPGSTEFVYRYDGEEHPVATEADGTATITLTPNREGGHYLYVSSRTTSGVTSGEGTYYFYVNAGQ